MRTARVFYKLNHNLTHVIFPVLFQHKVKLRYLCLSVGLVIPDYISTARESSHLIIRCRIVNWIHQFPKNRILSQQDFSTASITHNRSSASALRCRKEGGVLCVRTAWKKDVRKSLISSVGEGIAPYRPRCTRLGVA